MDTKTIIDIVALFILLILSAFFSSAETALTTASAIRLRTLSEAGDKRAKKVLKILDDPSKMLSAILIGNNLVNLSASAIATSLALNYWGDAGVGAMTFILTFVILIWGEISPKTIATLHADRISLMYANIIYMIMVVFTPVIYIINALSMAFLKLLRVNPNGGKKHLTERELRTIMDVSHESGIIETEEHEIINNVFDFTDAQAKEIMIPRIDMTFIPVTASYEEILSIYQETHYTRFPIYEDTTDNVIGILNVKDLLLWDCSSNFSLRDIMREPFFTYEHKNTAELFAQMKTSSINFAIVLNEYGTTAGLVTLEDLLEEIVGEIHDEYDAAEDEVLTQVSETQFLVQGSMNLDDLCDDLDLNLTSDDYDSIGGYVLEQLDHLPEEGEMITTEDQITLKVVGMDKNRIEKILITIPENYKEEGKPE